MNADDPEIAIQTKNEVNGLNLFTYCCNDPVNYDDFYGHKKAKSISNKTRNKIIKAYKQALNKAKDKSNNSLSYVYKNSKNSYNLTKTSNGIYELSTEHKCNNRNVVYLGVFIYGDSKAWDNEYQSLMRTYMTTKGISEAFYDIGSIPLIYTAIIFLALAFTISMINSLVIFKEADISLKRYRLSKKNNDCYAYIQTLTKIYYVNNRQYKEYIIK